MKKIIPLLMLIPFAGYTALVIVEHGYFGFLTLAWREPWAMQLLLDLSISIFLIGSWIRKDAKEHGITAWPYLVLLVPMGSIATLSYFVHRSFKSEMSSSSSSSSRKASASRSLTSARAA